ncbi:MAG: sigma factor, partial [Planctomycetota bacterium]
MGEDAAQNQQSNAGGPGSDPTSYARRLEGLREAALRFAFRMLGNIHDAEEAVQDAFVGLLRAS